MKIDVLLFGPQAEIAGTDMVSVELEAPATAAAVMHALKDVAPMLGPSLASSRLAINHAYAMDTDELSVNDEVALIGMVSGG